MFRVVSHKVAAGPLVVFFPHAFSYLLHLYPSRRASDQWKFISLIDARMQKDKIDMMNANFTLLIYFVVNVF